MQHNRNPYCKINCLLWQARHATGRHADAEIAAACFEILRLLPRDCPAKPGHPGEYYAYLERARHGSNAEKFAELIRAIQLVKVDEGELSLSCARTDHAACGECETDTGCDCSCHPRPFTFQDALAIMERGGECEHWWPASNSWIKSRIRNGKREYKYRGIDEWTEDKWQERWESLDWRPCSATTQYTWEQAEAGMRAGEIWIANHAWFTREYKVRFNAETLEFEFKTDVHQDAPWSVYLHRERGRILREATWRPYNPEAQR